MIRASSVADLGLLVGDLGPEVLLHLVVGLGLEELPGLGEVLPGRGPGPPGVDDRLQLGVAAARVAGRAPVTGRLDAGEIGLESIQLRGELTELLEHRAAGVASGRPALRLSPLKAAVARADTRRSGWVGEARCQGWHEMDARIAGQGQRGRATRSRARGKRAGVRSRAPQPAVKRVGAAATSARTLLGRSVVRRQR